MWQNQCFGERTGCTVLPVRPTYCRLTRFLIENYQGKPAELNFADSVNIYLGELSQRRTRGPLDLRRRAEPTNKGCPLYRVAGGELARRPPASVLPSSYRRRQTMGSPSRACSSANPGATMQLGVPNTPRAPLPRRLIKPARSTGTCRSCVQPIMPSPARASIPRIPRRPRDGVAPSHRRTHK